MNLVQAFDIRVGDVVAFVGGGGKTSALLRLARELAGQGLRVLSTTTTRVARHEIDRSINQLALGGAQLPPPTLMEALRSPGHLFVYQRFTPDGKLQGLRTEWFDRHLASPPLADVLLVEADGSRRLPFKGPYSHEPSIPSSATLVVPVVGLDVLGQPLDQEHVYGADMISATTGYPEGQTVTPGLVAEVIVHPWLGLKGVPEQARVIPLLNKVETNELFEASGEIARRMLQRRSVSRVAVGAVLDERGPVWEIHRRVGVIVLAAGRSTRMGEMKVLLPWGDTTVVGHICRTLAEIGLDTTVVLGYQAQAVADALAGLQVNLVRNPDFESGEMISSLRVGLSELDKRGAEAALVVLGDQPGILPDVIQDILQAYRQGLAGIVLPSYERQRGHPVLIDRRHWAALEALPPGSAPRDVVRANEDDIFHVEVDTPYVLRDLDTPEDYRRALRDFEAGHI